MMKSLKYLVSCGLLLFSLTAAAQTTVSDALQVTTDSLKVGADGMTVGTLHISLSDTCRYTAFNLSLQLPRGLRVVQTEGQYQVALSARDSATHRVAANALTEENLFKVLVAAPENKVLATGQEGGPTDLLSIDFVAEDMVAGIHEILLSGIKFVCPDGRAYVPVEEELKTVVEVMDLSGIGGVAADEDSDIYYDMSGRRVLHPQRGVYIKNNKKVWIQGKQP